MSNALLPDLEVSIGFGIPPIADEDDYSFTDVTSYVWVPSPGVQGGSPITISRGRQSALSRFEAGQCTLTLRDPDRRFDPTNPGSPYYPYVRPLARLRVRARWPKTSGTWRELYNGYIDTWEPVRTGAVATLAVRIRAVDGLAIMNRAEFNGSGSAGQTTRSAFAAILDAIGWPSGTTKRQLDLGANTPLVARTYTNANALASLQAVSLAEGGALYMDSQGRITFHAREWRAENRTVAATFDNRADLTSEWILGTSLLGVTTVPRDASWSPGDLEVIAYTGLRGRADDQTIINDAKVTRTGGAEQTATNATSQTDYGIRSYTEASIVETDAEALDRAGYLVARYGTPEYRVEELTTQFMLAPTEAMKIALINTVDIEAFVLVYDRRGAGTTNLVLSECRVEGVTHTIAYDQWSITYRLSTDPAFWVLEDETLGVLDETTVLGW